MVWAGQWQYVMEVGHVLMISWTDKPLLNSHLPIKTCPTSHLQLKLVLLFVDNSKQRPAECDLYSILRLRDTDDLQVVPITLATF